jgi:hypothetical protein
LYDEILEEVQLYCTYIGMQCCGSGSGAFLTPGSGMNNPDHIFESLETICWVKYLNYLMRIREGKIRIRDPRRKNSDPGQISPVEIRNALTLNM